MDDSSNSKLDEDPTDLSKPPQPRPDASDRLTSQNKCPNDIRKPPNQIPRRYDTKMLDARLLSNVPQERENEDSELTKQFYSSSDRPTHVRERNYLGRDNRLNYEEGSGGKKGTERPSQEGNKTNQQTEANSTNDVHQLEKQFKSSSDYPSMVNLMTDPTNQFIEANSNTSFNPCLWIHPRINYLRMIETNETTSNGSLDQQHYSSADHPTLARDCNHQTRIEQSSHDDHETYQSQLEWKIQRWLTTNEWNQSYPPCQVKEIDTTNETQVSNTSDQYNTEHNNAYSTCQTETDNSTFYAYPDQIDY